MKDMPEQVQWQFMKGQHTMTHNIAIFYGIWSDMAIKATYLRCMHRQSVMIGITLALETLKTREFSLNVCNKVVSSLDIRNNEPPPSQAHHK